MARNLFENTPGADKNLAQFPERIDSGSRVPQHLLAPPVIVQPTIEPDMAPSSQLPTVARAQKQSSLNAQDVGSALSAGKTIFDTATKAKAAGTAASQMGPIASLAGAESAAGLTSSAGGGASAVTGAANPYGAAAGALGNVAGKAVGGQTGSAISGASQGVMLGMQVGGPMGAAVGGVLGGAGGLFGIFG